MTHFLYIKIGILSGGEPLFGSLLIKIVTSSGVDSYKLKAL